MSELYSKRFLNWHKKMCLNFKVEMCLKSVNRSLNMEIPISTCKDSFNYNIIKMKVVKKEICNTVCIYRAITV